MSAKYTPGPWAVNHAGDSKGISEVFVYAPHCGVDDVSVAADIVDPVTSQPSEANARLIAAAPELLEALQTIRGVILLQRDVIERGMQAKAWALPLEVIDAAIQKATAGENE
jgi:hypothetical protein